MATLNRRITTTATWLAADPVRVQLAVMLIAALSLAVFAVLALNGHAAPITGPASGGQGGSG